MELGQLLQFLDDWLATDHGPVKDSLTRFVGCDAYGAETLRDDLARFTFLLGGSDGRRPLLATHPRLNAMPGVKRSGVWSSDSADYGLG